MSISKPIFNCDRCGRGESGITDCRDMLLCPPNEWLSVRMPTSDAHLCDGCAREYWALMRDFLAQRKGPAA